jgi:Na+-transporting NADH:ubiquinone oxidoreductase subunit NqrC
MADNDVENPLEGLDDETLLRELKANNPEELAEEADLFSLGEKMKQWIEEDEIGKYIYNRINMMVVDESSRLFAEQRPDTDEAFKAHFQIKIAQAMLNLIQEAVERGRAAEELLTTADEMDTEIEP